MTEATCRDFGKPGCLETPDPKFHFQPPPGTDLEPVQFCSHCGPIRMTIVKAFLALWKVSPPDLRKKMEEEVHAMYEAERKGAS